MLSKNNLCKKRQKMTSNVWHCFCTYCIICTKEHRCFYYISALSCHTAYCRTQDQKYKTKTKAARPRPRPRLRGWSESLRPVVRRSQTPLLNAVRRRL